MNSIRHTQEQLYVTPQNWLCRLRCRIPLRHLATSSMGNIFWRHSHFSPKQPETTNSRWLQRFSPQTANTTFCYTMANISPSHIQQCLNLTMHFSFRHLAAKMLSQLYHNFISSPYFFPSYETCSINVNSLFHAAIKNLHIKANGIFVLFILLYFTTTLSEGITHTRKNTFLRKIIITTNPIPKIF